jgi:DNA polymerase-3 subunit epsilon
VLKKRGYRWNDGNDGPPKSWWRDVAEATAEDEVRFLKTEIYQRDDVDLVKQMITAFVRHSVRG